MPISNSPFPNDIMSPPPPMFNYARLPLSDNLTVPQTNVTAFFTFEIATNTDYVVGERLNLTVVLEIPVYQSNNIESIYVEPEAALKYSNMVPTDFSYLFLTNHLDNNGTRYWYNSQLIEYTVTGSFGFRLTIYGPLTLNVSDKFTTDPMFTISSRDLLISKRNLSLTTTLTFLILFFAVLDFVKIDKTKKSTQNHGENHRTTNQKQTGRVKNR